MIQKLFSKVNRYDNVKQVKSDVSQEEISKKLRLRISEDAYLRIKEYVSICPCEVGGTLFGTVDVNKGEIMITHIELPPQEVSVGSVEYEHIMPEPEKLIAITESKVDENGVAQGNKLLGTWHSHADMQVFASMTDEECAKKFLATPPIIPDTLFVTLIFNKKGEEFARIDYVISKDTITYIEGLDLVVDDNGRISRIKDECRDLYEKNVTEQVIVNVKSYTSDYGYGRGSRSYDYSVDDNYNYNVDDNASFLDDEFDDLDLRNVKPNRSNLSKLIDVEIELETQLDKFKGKRYKKKRQRIRKQLFNLGEKIRETRNVVDMLG